MKDSLRILIVNGQSMHESNATGITLESMFSGFDRSSILEVFYSQVRLEKLTDNYSRSICLPLRTVPFNLFVRFFIGRNQIKKYNMSINGLDLRSKEASRNPKAMLKTFVLGLINSSPIIIRDKDILKSIDSFKPDIVYTLGADIIPLKLAIFFSKRYNDIPILLHYMDNWPETKYSNSPFLMLFYRKLQKLLRIIRNNNKLALVISDKMAYEYNSKYKPVTHYSIMNAIDVQRGKPVIEEPRKESATVFAYLGGLHLGRDAQLIKVQNIIEQINNDEKQERAKLLIYTTQDNRERFEHNFDKKCVRFMDYVPHDRVFEEYSRADVLLHIESFDESLVEFTKYSISTKISEYMYSGRPILLYAPKEIAVFQYVQSCHCGLCANDIDSLMSSIKELIYDGNLRKKLGQNGYRNAVKKHSREAAYSTIMNVSKALIDDRNNNLWDAANTAPKRVNLFFHR